MTCVSRVFGRLSVATALGIGAAAVAPVVPYVNGYAFAQSASSIVVRGNQRIEADAVRAYFQNGANGRLDAVAVDEGLRRLYATGLFQDVRVSRSGGAIVVTVVENSVINNVNFKGNKRIKDAVIAPEVQSKARGPYSANLVQADVQRIEEIYRRSGRAAASVEAQTVTLPNGRIDLVFQIDEGKKTKIKTIDFVGNEAYSDGRLRDEMNTTRSNFLSWLKSSDVYDPDRLNADLELVRRFYMNRGYADFRVVDSQVDFDEAENAYSITITVEEGTKYDFGAIDVESNVADVDPDSLRRLVETKSGGTYDAEAVDKTVEALSIEVATRGYAFARVRPRGSRDYATNSISVAYVVEEGPRVYVERINVRGNTRTRDYVIRREFDLAEGDAYNQALINRAERRLKNLGYFERVVISSEPGSAPDRIVVNVDVVDQATGEFSVAGGYSTSDGIIGEVGIAEKNFLGRGQYVKLSGSWGERTNGFEFAFTEPYFLGHRISAGFDVYRKYRDSTNYASYESDVIGGALRLGLPITENLQLGLNYTGYNRDITIPSVYKDGDSSNGEASVGLKQAEGETFTSSVGYTLVYNSLDNNRNPSEGLYAEFKQDFAGVGGDVNFIRSTADARYYHELPGELIGFVRLQGGHIAGWGDDEDLRILDHFYKGPDLVRGFRTSGIGPRDLNSPNLDAIGGTAYFGGTLEVQFPLFGIPKDFGLKGAVFADAGTVMNFEGQTDFGADGTIDVWDDDSIRSSVGASLLWASPLGPIRFDYAYVLSSGEYDKEQAFRFSGGTKF
ncbi:outer membrane protein assembly factor BamA [Agaricicola taiwanensis]|uniref:Outer membrane protein assembly factor BamA n=1 Tax=Agaricicola taiwanensis TaxID=591372 RepID=A0A8J2YI85_9RHOB|nr:outer membrane protein assembly factor BamA [Agaricicola taiwanensis]GGE44374.1 outer membrane protein assembly factor BamA [Agaricicola taiwanensis]